jgi:lysozyme family protein
MMFDISFERVFTNEGEFQQDPLDRGNWTSGIVGLGELKGTKYGISAMTYPDLDIKSLSLVEAKEIYKRDWWDKLRMERFHTSFQYQLFDASINHGIHNASRMLQRALKVSADGIIGPKTVDAATEIDINDLLLRFLAERLVFMTHVRTWGTNGKGWARRIAHNLIAASNDN